MDTERTLKLEIKKEDLKDLLLKIAKDYQKNVKIQGFRPGKAPLEIVKTKFAKEIEEDAIEEYVREKVLKEVEKENSKLASPIYLKEKKEKDDGFEIVVLYEVLPPFEVKGYESIKVEKRIKRASPDEVEKRIKKYQESVAELKDKEGGAKEGDFLVLKYNVSDISGRQLVKDKTESFKFTKENVPPDFYNELEGKKRGESFKIARNEEQGTLIYEGKVLSVKEVILPPLDDEFAKMFEMENMEEFRKKISEEINEDLQRESEEELENRILEELSKLNPVPVPRSYIEEEVRNIIARYGLREEEVKEMGEELIKVAEEKIRRRLLLDRLAEQLKVEVKKEEVDREIESLASIYRMNPQNLRRSLEERGAIKEVERSIKRRKAMEFLKSQVKMEVIIE